MSSSKSSLYTQRIKKNRDARRATEHAEVIRLSLADQESFTRALLSPPQPAPALKRAFARRRMLLCAG